MRAAVYRGLSSVEMDNVPDPVIQDPKDAIVKITSGAICGSDLHIYRGHFPLNDGDTLGHEHDDQDQGRAVKYHWCTPLRRHLGKQFR